MDVPVEKIETLADGSVRLHARSKLGMQIVVAITKSDLARLFVAMQNAAGDDAAARRR